MTKTTNKPIAVFDSGVGGISILKALVETLPDENFYYYGDSAYAPYGEKTTEEVRNRTIQIAEQFINDGAKAIVVACNTATSAAIKELRETWPDMIFIGVEPAIKPAVEERENARVLVVATPITIYQPKFQTAYKKYADENTIYPVACPGLAGRIEKGHLYDDDIIEMIEGFVGAYRGKIDSIVLGCTHYPFIQDQILDILGDVKVYESAASVARHLKHVLQEAELSSEGPGSVEFASSLNTEEELALYKHFFNS